MYGVLSADTMSFSPGASAVAVGSAHFPEPRVGGRIIKQLEKYMNRNSIAGVGELVGAAEPW